MLRLLLATFLATLIFHPGDAEGRSDKGISIRLFAAALNKDQGPVCILIGKTRSEAFELPTLGLSEPMTVKAREFILISAATPPNSAPAPLATIQLPDKGTDFRIILAPDGTDAYKHMVISGKDPKFGGGDLCFINLSSHDIIGQVGDTELDMKPDALNYIRPTAEKSAKSLAVTFSFRDKEKVMVLTDTSWPIVRDNRSIVVFHEGRGDRPSYHAVDEFISLSGTEK